MTFLHKSSAAAEMGDHDHKRHGPKEGELLCLLLRWSWIPV